MDGREFMRHYYREQERSRDIEHEKKLAEIRTQSRALVWTGPADELLNAIKRFYEAGWIKADDLVDAINKASLHFVGPDGKPIIGLTTPAKPQITSRLKSLDEHYQTIEFDNKQYALTPTQSTVVRILHQASIQKRSSVGLKEIYEALGTNTGKMSHWFRGANKSLYGKLIVQTASRNHYRLDI